MSEYNIINGNQHGYTRGRSCLTDLLEFFKVVYETIDEGKLKGVTYPDNYWVNGEEAQILDGDLRRMFKWSQDWQTQFNLESVHLCI